MSSNDTDTTVSEYLADVAQRVSDLPLLQRRELLTDLESHIEAERIDRDAVTPGQVLEILERLGSPEEIAAAARAEAPTVAPRAEHARVAATPRRPAISATAVIVGFVVLLVVVIATCSTFLINRASSEPAPPVAVPVESGATDGNTPR